MGSITVHPRSKKEASLFEQMAKALRVPFEKNGETNPYRQEFIAKIKKGEADKKAGRYKVIKTEYLWK